MTRSHVAAELAGVVRLVREHAFLRYTPSGRLEYEQKLKAADGLFAAIMSSATGVTVPNPFPHGVVEGLEAPDADSVVRAARRTAARLARAAKTARGAAAAGLELAAAAWLRGAAALAALPR